MNKSVPGRGTCGPQKGTIPAVLPKRVMNRRSARRGQSTAGRRLKSRHKRKGNTMANVVLHQWDISPYCRKVRKALRFKGIPYETVDYNGMRAPQAARLATSRKLPVLDWDGQRIADSSLICTFPDQHVGQRRTSASDPDMPEAARKKFAGVEAHLSRPRMLPGVLLRTRAHRGWLSIACPPA